MKRVVLESPYAGDVAQNLRYARLAMRDSLDRGEAPFASHLLYAASGVLDDNDPKQRQLGIDAGLEWGSVSAGTVAYIDLGVSLGMDKGVAYAREHKRPVELRKLGFVPRAWVPPTVAVDSVVLADVLAELERRGRAATAPGAIAHDLARRLRDALKW